ncbi:MAG TPA: VOC family protein [Candidatus Saccharimonadales bacterium]|nr:VOC family protein [Candidatus Saccharimonadales bacterium]
MDLKSVSGLTLFVRDIDKTAKFYKTLGFKVEKHEKGYLLVRLNWFSMDFVAESGNAKAEPKCLGICINISVDDVDEFYKNVLAKGLKPASEPQDFPGGFRNFVLNDPDGYNLIMFKRGKPRSPAG